MWDRLKTSGWFWVGIAIGVFTIVGWFGTPASYTNGSGREIKCGTLASPNYPRDGRGPCSDIFDTYQTFSILLGVAAVACVGIGIGRAMR